MKKINGFTLIEILITLVILGIFMLSISSYLIITYRVTNRNKNNVIAISLANGLMEEILSRRWDERYDTGSLTLGIDIGELITDKTTFDDIDDFNLYEESPPQDPLGNDLTAFGQFRLNVDVSYLTTAFDTTLVPTVRKQINIFIRKNDKILYNISSLKSQQKGL